MPSTSREPFSGRSTSTYRRYLEPAGLVGVAVLFIFFLAASWRKWPDPVIDFGLQLYTPWRIQHGAVFYRDLDYLYGPFSSYFNATLFSCFGTGLITLAAANIAIFVLIIAVTYQLFRIAWGIGPALLAIALYVSVFGFSQFSTIGNYNYITPYSHETTHGLLVCLLIVLFIIRWIERPSPGLSFTVGLLVGLTFVLKSEYALAGVLLVAAGIFLQRFLGQPAIIPLRSWLLMLLGAVLPTLAFTLYFGFHMPLDQAICAAANGWLRPLTTPMAGNPEQLEFLGFDHVATRLGQEIAAIVDAGLLFALIGTVTFCAARFNGKGTGGWIIPTLLSVFIITLSIVHIDWIESARCLPALSFLYLALAAWLMLRHRADAKGHRQRVARFLIALLSVVLISRMVLNGRFYQFGCFQAALSAILIPVALITELPGWIGANRAARIAATVATLCLVIPGAFILCRISLVNLAYKTIPIGSGPDLFYAFVPEVDTKGPIVQQALRVAQAEGPNQPLAVLPEGQMINYLLRDPAPDISCDFFSFISRPGQETRDLRALQFNPPRLVIILTRDLRSYRVAQYGLNPGEGKSLLDWIDSNYDLTSTIGFDPADPAHNGAHIFRRKTP